MMRGKVLARVLGIAVVAVVSAGVGRAQEQWTWPEKPSNLQVLPKDWPGTRLRPVMTGFTRALGVRCSYCHKGEEGKPLSTYDFPSDENPNKNRAREMLRMLGDINDHLKKIEPSGDKRVNMWCHTCHHGRPRPMTLPEELGEQYRKNGIKPTLDYYADLKKKYYTRGAYDFGEGSLNEFGYNVLEKDAAGALLVFQLNAEQFPQSANAWDSLAEAYLKAGDPKKAAENYEKSLALDPKNENAKEQLKKIKESKEK
ncbi:MAG TPA: c-type cytochrome [Candidatus Dormibacteraeota bacterium]|nr:c-type cytochrome [Candidatus Dormibacteraeota bacterium]